MPLNTNLGPDFTILAQILQELLGPGFASGTVGGGVPDPLNILFHPSSAVTGALGNNPLLNMGDSNSALLQDVLKHLLAPSVPAAAPIKSTAPTAEDLQFPVPPGFTNQGMIMASGIPFRQLLSGEMASGGPGSKPFRLTEFENPYIAALLGAQGGGSSGLVRQIAPYMVGGGFGPSIVQDSSGAFQFINDVVRRDQG